jgi:oxygen-independent coproporphyrinogen-3 oxidase
MRPIRRIEIVSTTPVAQLDERTQLAVHTQPRATYVHVPFCRHRCGYCNFTLITGRDDLISGYLRAIELELNARQTPHEVDTLYFGGGTPTHLSPVELRTLAATVHRHHPLAAGYEWTVEANPSDITPTMIATLPELGVTRLSLGGQSFRPEKLRLLERDHEAADIARSIEFAKSTCLEVSLDLIFATPGETLDQWKADLDAAIVLAPAHISTYSLTFEQGTEFWNRKHRGEIAEADEELQRDMYALAIDRLTAAGYEHYEVSNFARPGRRSRHNQVYWSGDGYYAYGPGASRYVAGIRETNHRSTTTYLQKVLAGESPVAEREELSPEARAREFLVFSLRRIEGIARHTFSARTGYAIDELITPQLQKFTALGLLSDDGDRICLTREGLFISDAMWPEML